MKPKHEFCMHPVSANYDPGEWWTLKESTPVPCKAFKRLTHTLKTFEDAKGNTRTVLALASCQLFAEPKENTGILSFNKCP